ncbi:MAG: STAS domain-containing protein [Leptolyngbya sp. SIO1E4]|nr:STAS domain-containing protein [Leptolyngbya sp. SIO1E4]
MKSGVKIIEPVGILDGTKGETFRQQVYEALDQGADTILIDLKDVTFVDSSGLGILVAVLKRARTVQKKMYICSVNDQVRMLFELSSMDRVFEVFHDRAEFEHKMVEAANA